MQGSNVKLASLLIVMHMCTMKLVVQLCLSHVLLLKVYQTNFLVDSLINLEKMEHKSLLLNMFLFNT